MYNYPFFIWQIVRLRGFTNEGVRVLFVGHFSHLSWPDEMMKWPRCWEYLWLDHDHDTTYGRIFDWEKFGIKYLFKKFVLLASLFRSSGSVQDKLWSGVLLSYMYGFCSKILFFLDKCVPWCFLGRWSRIRHPFHILWHLYQDIPKKCQLLPKSNFWFWIINIVLLWRLEIQECVSLLIG